MTIEFYVEEGQRLPSFLTAQRIQYLASLVEQSEHAEFCSLEYSWLGRQGIVEINKQYLGNDYVTDIITFRLDAAEDDVKNIEGVICICLDRVEEQALDLNLLFEQECMRVCVHGLLHLCGYEDHTELEKVEMRAREDFYLKKLNLL